MKIRGKSAEVKEQFILRVRRNSELDGVLGLVADGNYHNENEIRAAGGKDRSGWLLRMLGRQFDNVTIKTKNRDRSIGRSRETRINYVDVFPEVPVSIGMDVHVDGEDIGAAIVGAAEPESRVSPARVQWPQMPPVIESMGDIFKEPKWFTDMERMTEAGRHISLAGPPGVGKDTAVQELAAQEGKILVTIGGDAGFRRRDLVGSQQISNGRSYFEVAEYAAAVVNGWWALISEVNAADADALLFINTQLAPPYIINIAGKSYAVHPNFRLFVTYNAGLVGTKPLPQSFKDRFFSIKIPFWSKDGLRGLLQAHGMPEGEEYDRLVNFAMLMWDAHERGTIRYQITSRRLMDAVELMKNGTHDAEDALKLAVLASIDSPLEVGTAKSLIEQSKYHVIGVDMAQNVSQNVNG